MAEDVKNKNEVVDKHQSMLKYIMSCPLVRDNPLFFNFGELKEGSNQYMTTSNSEAYNKNYIDGSVAKTYIFTILTYRTISYNPIVKEEGKTIENITELSELQQLIEWIDAQDLERNYPDFGSKCQIDKIYCTAANPQLTEVNADVDPAIATYSVTIQVDYVDNSKQIIG